jgi:hypothetical protein
MRKIARISIASTTAALCLCVASPALACVVPSDFTHSLNPVAAAIAKADHGIAAQQQRLDRWTAKVNADPNLTATQKSDFTALMATAKAALATQRTAVDAATSVDEVTADVQSNAAVVAANAAVNLALAIVGANDFIVGEENGLTRQATKVAAESDLTSAQKTALATQIAAAQTTLQGARTTVNGATTTAAVKSAQQSTRAPLAAINLRLAIDRADDQIGAVQAKLANWAAQIAAATNLTDQVKAAAAAKIAAAEAGLTALQGKIDAATSPAQVAALMRSAHFAGQPWRGDDPSKLPKVDPAQLAAAKRAASNHPQVASVTPPKTPTLVVARGGSTAKSTPKPTSKPNNGSGTDGHHNSGGRGANNGHTGHHGR